jgi:molybdopterin/thiamine biosynthesis adenylyltransferase
MIEITISDSDMAFLRATLLADKQERCAVLLASHVRRSDGTDRLLIKRVCIPNDSDYAYADSVSAQLKPPYVAAVTKMARSCGDSLVFVHSHPSAEEAHFSRTDDDGEDLLLQFLNKRAPGSHASIVLAQTELCARSLATDERATVVSIGRERKVLSKANSVTQIDAKFDRQVRAFGTQAQRELEQLTVAIVGLGGTGSVLFQQLVHLGVCKFVLIDPDTLDATNLNRVANASISSVGMDKVMVAKDYASKFDQKVVINAFKGDVTRVQYARELLAADFIFGCTDSHGSRSVIQQICYQYLIPVIDMGVTIVIQKNTITNVIGRVQLLAPGLACFTCSALLNPNEVRKDLMSEYERKQDPYIVGANEPAPAVMSLNSTVASLATTMLLSCVAGVPMAGRALIYNGITSTLRKVEFQPTAECYVCSKNGALALGDAWPLPARMN